jgi:RNA polymerase sigma-54 factor
MRQGLQLRLSQHLALTPQLQQSIRLLQLSTLELNAEIDQALQDNPLLERDDPGEPAAFNLGASTDAQAAPQTPSAAESDDREERQEPRGGDAGAWISPAVTASATPTTTTPTAAKPRPHRIPCVSTSVRRWR